jgi:hypothetical protein
MNTLPATSVAVGVVQTSRHSGDRFAMEIVVVVLNKTGDSRPFILCAGGRECAASIPPRSIQTLTFATS